MFSENDLLNNIQWLNPNTGGNGLNIPYNTTIGSSGLVIFYGFNGLLAQKYSVIQGMSREEITSRMIFAGDKIPYMIDVYSTFLMLVEKFKGTPNALTEIDFDDAMNIIRIGLQVERSDDFEEADEDEFDDNCVETCKPGNHTCGK